MSEHRVPREAVVEDFQHEFERILEGGALGVHAKALAEAFKLGQPDLRGLFSYGLACLPAEHLRPDDGLATFFVVVSELNRCPWELRIFATKCVEYCESEALDGWSDSLAQLKQAFEVLKQNPNWPR